MTQLNLLAAKDLIERLKEHNIDPNGSISRPVQDIMQSSDQNKFHWDDKVAFLVGNRVETNSWYESRMFYGYLVQEALKHHQSGYANPDHDVIGEAAKKAKVQVSVSFLNPARAVEVVVDVDVPEEDQTPAVRPRRSKHGKRGSGGSKKERAIVLYVQAQKDGLSGRQVIDLFKEQLDLSEAGARTYEYNLRKELWK